jgi:hypothetical protein
MLELALLIVLVGSVCFLTYELFKMNHVYQDRMHYYRFLPSLSMPEVTRELDRGTIDSDLKLKVSNLDYSVKEMQARMDRQETVIEKLIKGLGD